ncbi:MAG: hypothetical protein VKJ02_19935 [Snowella sp.]|nr:hypothetical protein [Snowella sp.]
MNQQPFTPDIEQVKRVSLQFQEVFQRMDREISVLDKMIAELDEQIQASSVSRISKTQSLKVIN